MLILGVDPGLANTGWAVLQKEGPKLLDYGVILTNNETREELRVEEIYNQLLRLILKYKIGVLALEKLFFAKNITSALKVAEIIGVLKLLAALNKMELKMFTPLQVKMALVGYGRAEKEQVEKMVRAMLSLPDLIKPSHASDAVAIALTFVYSKKFD